MGAGPEGENRQMAAEAARDWVMEQRAAGREVEVVPKYLGEWFGSTVMLDEVDGDSAGSWKLGNLLGG